MRIHEVNARGGLKVGNKTVKLELIEYDDRTSGEDAVKNIERLASVDKVNFIVTPFGTGINVATEPIIAKYGYPHVVTSATTNDVPKFAKQWLNSFWLLGTSSHVAGGVAEALIKLRESDAIGKRAREKSKNRQSWLSNPKRQHRRRGARTRSSQ